MVFIQIVQARCSRRDEIRDLILFRRDAIGQPTGWLGKTFGFTDDDEFIAVVRFESCEAAMANSNSAAQRAFAERMGALADGPVEFHDCEDVTAFFDGGSDRRLSHLGCIGP